jgi:S-adenosylmethionine uptake transporter
LRAQPLSPALVLVAGTIAGCAMDATIKHLALTNHVLLVTFARFAFGAAFSAVLWLRAGKPAISAEMWRGHGMRGLVIAAAATSFFYGLSVLPLAEAVTFSFIYPLLIPLIARVLLGEHVRASSFVAAAIGFLGILVAAQGAPTEAEAPNHTLGIAAVLFSAVTFALAMVQLRQRALTDGPVISGMMSSLIPAFIIAGPALVIATPPRLDDWPVFLLLGILAAVFMYLIARAYSSAEAQKLAPIHYLELVWASGFGYLIFQEEPRPEIYAGAVLIVAACLYVAYDERRTKRLVKS